MQEFINFIVNNWQFVSSVAISVVSFILLLIFRRNKSVLIDEGFYREVLKLVIEAENLFGSGHGKEKLDYVISKAMYSHPAWVEFEGFSRIIEKAVDDILSSPEKKVKK